MNGTVQSFWTTVCTCVHAGGPALHGAIDLGPQQSTISFVQNVQSCLIVQFLEVLYLLNYWKETDINSVKIIITNVWSTHFICFQWAIIARKDKKLWTGRSKLKLIEF